MVTKIFFLNFITYLLQCSHAYSIVFFFLQITSQGAVYVTVNGGLNWKAQVKETIDATLNRVSSSGTSGASFFTGKIANQVCPECGKPH